MENNCIRFKRNVVSEREFNKTNIHVFGAPDAWDCKIPADGSGGEQHIGIMKNFADAILHGSPLLSPGYEGINGLTISNAIHYSAWTGGWADVKHFPHDEFYKMLQEKISGSTVVKDARQVTADTDNSY